MTGTEQSKTCAKVVARAIFGSRKFNKSEHSEVLKGFSALRKSHPQWSDEIDERINAVSNLSAFSKDLAKAGIVSEGEPSAWVREIAEAVDEVAKEMDAALNKGTGNGPKPAEGKPKS